MKRVITVIAIQIFCLSLFSCTTSSAPSEAQTISDQCQTQEREVCLKTKILAITKAHPEKLISLFNDFSTLLKTGTLTDDPRIFSPIIHEVGMEMVFNQIPPTEAFTLCPLNFKAGCLHGVVMEALDDSSTVDFTFCDFSQNDSTLYKNCIHGLGHELAAKSTGDLNETLALCSVLKPALNYACITGVFMEFSTGVHGTGQHTHEPPTGSILLPCQNVDPLYQSACYSAMSSYRQYLPTTEVFTETAAACLAAPKPFQSPCLLGLAEKIFTSSAEDLSKAYAICESFATSEVDTCKLSVDHINELESVL